MKGVKINEAWANGEFPFRAGHSASEKSSVKIRSYPFSIDFGGFKLCLTASLDALDWQSRSGSSDLFLTEAHSHKPDPLNSHGFAGAAWRRRLVCGVQPIEARWPVHSRHEELRKHPQMSQLCQPQWNILGISLCPFSAVLLMFFALISGSVLIFFGANF